MRDLAPFLEQLRSRILLSDVIRVDVALKHKGHTFSGLCPFHKEKSPSFTVDDVKGTYHCFGCGVSGDAFNYLQEKRGFTFMEAVEHLSNQIGLQLPKREIRKKTEEKTDRSYEILEKATLWMEDNLTRSIGQKARDYLEKRGITQESQKIFRIGYTPPSKAALWEEFKKTYTLEEMLKVGLVIVSETDKSPIDRFRGRLMFPISDRRGRVIAFGGRALEDVQPKYLNSAETPYFSKGKVLYSHHLAQKYVDSTTGYIVVEGYLDVISLYQHGFKTAVAALGTALTEDHAQLFWRHQVPPVLCFDGDKAGYNAAIRSAMRMLPLISQTHRLEYAFLPEGEDPDSIVQKDKNQFLEILQKPQALSEILWQNFKQTISFKTAEDQAILKKKIKETVALIKNEDIKEAYQDYFNNQFIKLKESLKPVKIYTKSFMPNVKPSTLRLTRPLQQQQNLLLFQQILLATLIFHPYLILKVSDKLSYINFDERFDALFDFIIAYQGPLEKDAFIHEAEKKGLKAIINDLLEQKVLTKAPFIQKTEGETVLLGWQEIYNRLEYSLNINKEVEQAAKDLKQEFDEVRWNRIKELQALKLKGLIDNE